MTLEQNFQRRTALHNRRGRSTAFQNRAAAAVPPKVDPVKAESTSTSTKPATTPATKPTVTPDPKDTSTSAKTTSSSTSSASKATTSSSSTTSSAPATTSSTSSTTSASTTTSSLPSTTSLSSSTLSHTSASSAPRLTGSASAAQADATQSAAPTTTSGLGTMTLVGIIFGSLIGVAIVCVVIAFVIRHMRKKRRRLDGFDSAKFRRFAVVLNEKDQEPDFRPRPPTMIERRQGTPVPPSGGPTSFPPPPTMAYPYSDRVQSAPMPPAPPAMYGAANPQYGALPPPPPPPSQANMYGTIPGAYGVPAPGAFGSQYDQAGYGAPPIPGTYAPGAYASYGPVPDPRYPHHYQQQQQGYPQYSNLASYQQQPAGAYGPRMDSLASSMSNPLLVEKQALRAADDSAARTIGAGMMSPSSSTSSSSSSNSSGSTLKRQPTQVGGAPPAYVDDDGEGAKLAARSDVKVKPIVMSPPGLEVSNNAGTSQATSSAAAPAGRKAGNRPVSAYSAYSLYDQDDAYGGI